MLVRLTLIGKLADRGRVRGEPGNWGPDLNVQA